MLLQSGWISLLDYLAAHVLLCLVPAFFIAGALSALIPNETVTRYLGPRACKFVGPAVNILAIAYTSAAIGLIMVSLQEERTAAGSIVMGGQA